MERLLVVQGKVLVGDTFPEERLPEGVPSFLEGDPFLVEDASLLADEEEPSFLAGGPYLVEDASFLAGNPSLEEDASFLAGEPFLEEDASFLAGDPFLEDAFLAGELEDASFLGEQPFLEDASFLVEEPFLEEDAPFLAGDHRASFLVASFEELAAGVPASVDTAERRAAGTSGLAHLDNLLLEIVVQCLAGIAAKLLEEPLVLVGTVYSVVTKQAELAVVAVVLQEFVAVVYAPLVPVAELALLAAFDVTWIRSPLVAYKKNK